MGFFEDLYEQGFFPSEDARPEDVEGVRQAQSKVTALADKIVERLGEGGEELFDEFLSAKAAADGYCHLWQLDDIIKRKIAIQ